MAVKKIGVIGAGQMGHGIALVAAKAGFDVILRDIKDEYVKKLDIIIKKNSQYQTISIVDKIQLFTRERDELKNNTQALLSFIQNQNDGTIIYVLEKLGRLENGYSKKPLLNLLNNQNERINPNHE